jgi:hypothetical protein
MPSAVVSSWDNCVTDYHPERWHSVTIGECEIRHPVFERLDPMHGDARVEQDSWQFGAISMESILQAVIELSI